VLGSFNPFLCFAFEHLDWHAGERRDENFLKIMQRQLGHLLAVAGQHSFERLPLLEFRLLRDHCWNTLKAIEHLCVHGVLDPQRAVLIESRDAFFGRHKLCARSLGRRANEVNDGLLSGSVVPRREWTIWVLRRGRRDAEQCRHGK
jgi:hypothetical protein